MTLSSFGFVSCGNGNSADCGKYVMVCLWKRTPCMLLKSPGKVLEKSLNKRLSNLYEP